MTQLFIPETCTGLGLAGIPRAPARLRLVNTGTTQSWDLKSQGFDTDSAQEPRTVDRPLRFLSRQLISIKS